MVTEFDFQFVFFCSVLTQQRVYWRWWFGLVGDAVGRISEVNQRRAQLELGWVTFSR